MPEIKLTPGFFFNAATEVFAQMTGLEPNLSIPHEVVYKNSEHDLIVIMGIVGDQPFSFALAMDGDTVLGIADSIMSTEAGMTMAEAGVDELPELLQGAIEELTNRISSATVNKLAKEVGGSYDLTPPVCVFGKLSDIGGALAGEACVMNTSMGEVELILAREDGGAA